MTDLRTSRRQLLRAGTAGAGGLALASAAGIAAPAAHAASRRPAVVTDLGPAVVQFSLMSAALVGDVLYVGSRNLDPVTVVGLDVASGRVVRSSELGTGHSIQAMAADPDGRYLYVGVLQDTGGPQPNLYRWDLSTPEVAAEPIGRIGDRDVRALSVAPDGRVHAVGGGSATPPALWEYDPASGQVENLGTPDPRATLARAVAATATTVFFGAGSTLGGGGDVSRACLYAYDRASGVFTSITPAEMLPDPSIRELTVDGDRLLVSSAASTEQSKVASVDLGDLTSYVVATSIGKTAKNFAVIGDDVYFANEDGLCRFSVAAAAVEAVTLDGLELGEIWGVHAREGHLLVTSAYGFVADVDPQARTSTTTDLAAAGAPAGPQVVMGIAASKGLVYVGGNGVLARHRLRDRSVVNLRAPGEAKDAVVVRGELYTGQYNAQGIWAHDPRRGTSIAQVASFPSEQNRPQDVTWDPVNRLLVVGVQSDTEGGGALWTYDPASKQARSLVNPIDAQQYPRAVATRQGIAYVGGSLQGTTGPGTVVALDPTDGRELWRTAPLPGAGVSALAVRGRHLYGVTRKGGAFVVDLRRRVVVHQADVSAIGTGFMRLVTNRDVVYGVSDTNVFRFDPRTFAATVVVADIDGGWYSGAHIAHDERGMLYTMRGRNLVRIDDSRRR